MAATIGVKEGVGGDNAGDESTAKCSGDDVGVERVGEFPSEDGTAEEVEDNGKVEPAFAGGDVGYVAEEVGAGRCWCPGPGE